MAQRERTATIGRLGSNLAGRFERRPNRPRRRRDITCATCSTVNDAHVARWCGHCGARLTTDAVGPTSRAPRELSAPDLTRLRMIVGPAFAVLMLLVLIVPAALRDQVGTSRGQSERGDAQRTGVVAEAAPAAPREVVWELETSAPLITESILRPATDHATVVNGDLFEVLDLATGRVVRTQDRSATRSALALARPFGDVLLVPSGTVIDGVGLQGGETRWAFVLGVSSIPAVASAHAIEQDVLFRIGATQLFRIGLDDGLTRWELDLGAAIGAGVERIASANAVWTTAVTVTPAGAELRAASTAVTSGVAVADSRTGEAVWSDTLTSDEGLLPVAASHDGENGDWLAHASLDGPVPLIRVRDLASGDDVSAISWSGDLLGLEMVRGVVVLSTTAGGVQGFDPASGQLLWTLDGPGGILGSDGQVLVARVGSTDGIRMVGFDGQIRATLDNVHPQINPALVNGLLALTTVDGQVAIHDLTGSQLWSRPLTANGAASIVTDGDLVAVNGRAGTVVLNGRSGERITSVERVSSGARPLQTASVALVDGLVVASPLTADGSGRALQAIVAETGISTWNKDGDQPPVIGPLTRDGDFVFIPVGDQIHGYDAPSGRRAFAEQVGMPRAPLAVTADLVVAAATADRCAGRATCDGALIVKAREREQAGLPRDVLWTSNVPVCGPPVISDETVLIPTGAGIKAMALATGVHHWTNDSEISCRPLAVRDDFVVQSVGTSLRALSLIDGSLHWTVEIGQTLATDPVIAGDEVVVGTGDGDLVALSLADGSVAWQFRLPSPALADPIVVGERWVVLLRDGRVVGLR